MKRIALLIIFVVIFLSLLDANPWFALLSIVVFGLAYGIINGVWSSKENTG